MKINLSEYKAAMQDELKAILSFWMTYTVDESNGGFIGRIDYNNKIINDAPKGAVLNARILWSFAAAYNLTGNKTYLEFAQRAFNYIITYFIDKDNRGVYWSVDYKGKPLDTKKQIYAQAFTIYAFSEFYKATKDQAAIIEAIDLYDVINKYSYDSINGGYTEAFTRDWDTISDLRLSDKDANEKKSMNTHLHLLEAFTALYKIWKYEPVRKNITALVQNFLQYIIDPSTHHQYLFFDEQWQPKSATISYGHDIETAWLLQEAAEAIEDEALITTTKLLAVKIAGAVKKGLDNDGGLWYEYEPAAAHLIKEKHMWPQAEAMVGYFNAYQNTNDEAYLDISLASWQFVQQHIHDKKNGEWFWGVAGTNLEACSYKPMQEDKVGIWKCPYHNSRACIEIIKRINHLEKQ
ncbi:AGE family epimerase/isomerase [Ferruginibacter profundus]